MQTISPMARKIVAAAGGHIVSLPYQNHAAMAEATREASAAGYIVAGYDDDQPTSVVTAAGREYLAWHGG